MGYNSFNMSILLFTLTVVIFIKLLILTAFKPTRSSFSKFELERRSGLGDKIAKNDLERDELLVDVLSLQRVLVALLLVIFVLLSVVTFGWFLGIIISLVVALEYGALARIQFINKLAQKIYDKFEKDIIKFIKKTPLLFKFLRNVPNTPSDASIHISSSAELQHLIDSSVGVLTPDEKKLVVNGLSFGDKLVSSVMTPRSVIDSIKSSEFLGPLTLDDLHKTGHSRLPVINGDIDHIVGILNLKSLLALDIKRSTAAEKAMDPKVFYIRQDQTLQHALAAFIRTHHHLFVVVNEFRETVGLLSLEDVMESLLGRKIVDEFDAHDDLRKVALRNPRDNNHPEKHEDV